MTPATYPEKEKKEKRTPYFTREVSTWDWKDFLAYWDKKYLDTFDRLPPSRAIKDLGKYKGMLTPNIERWGPEFFKEMIDWIFLNYYKYPKLDTFTISIVCGSHFYVEVISQEVAKYMQAQKLFNKE